MCFMNISKRFAGYLPVVVDCETEVRIRRKMRYWRLLSSVLVPDGVFCQGDSYHYHVEAFPGSVISEEALSVNQIRPDHPSGTVRPEAECLSEMAEKTSSM